MSRIMAAAVVLSLSLSIQANAQLDDSRIRVLGLITKIGDAERAADEKSDSGAGVHLFLLFGMNTLTTSHPQAISINK